MDESPPEIPVAFDEGQERLPEALSLNYILLEQVRRVLKAGSQDMKGEQTQLSISRDGSFQQTQGKDPKSEYVASVRSLWHLVYRKLPEGTQAELSKISEKIEAFKASEQAKQPKALEWFLYAQMREAFEIINDSLIDLDYFSSAGRRGSSE